MYCNVKSTGLPLGLFSTNSFWKLLLFCGDLFPKILDVTQYCCTLYLTARLFTIIQVYSLGPI